MIPATLPNKKKTMPSFRIWCRADDTGAGQFLAVVSAIPESPNGEPRALESESRLMKSRAEAIEACAHMATAFRSRIEARGDSVSIVEMV